MNAPLAIVAALASNRVIGKDGTLPWHLPEDLKHFRDLTSGHAVIMGRKTFESILAFLGKPLPNRRNIVITRSAQYASPGCEVVNSLADAINIAGTQQTYVIGGAEIYAQALPLAEILHLTEIDKSCDGDAWFPEFDRADWLEDSRESRVSATGLGYSFVSYRRNPKRR